MEIGNCVDTLHRPVHQAMTHLTLFSKFICITAGTIRISCSCDELQAIQLLVACVSAEMGHRPMVTSHIFIVCAEDKLDEANQQQTPQHEEDEEIKFAEPTLGR